MPLFIRLFLLLCTLKASVSAQNIPANTVFRNCVAVHDPENRWSNLVGKFTIQYDEAGTQSVVACSVHQQKQYFSREEVRDGHTLKHTFSRGRCKVEYDGTTIFSLDTKEKYGLSEAAGQVHRESFFYLSGAPMRQLADTAFLLPSTTVVTFAGKKCYQVTFQYPPDGQADVWRLYINYNTFQLEGYRIFNDNSSDNGFTVVLSDFVLHDEILFPKIRRWTSGNASRSFRTETILSITP